MTTFAVVSGVEGAGLSPRIVLILGATNVVGGGFSMAAGNDLATEADRQRLAPTAEDSARGASPDPRTAAGVTFAAFAAFAAAGAVPLLPYLFGGIAGGTAAGVSAALTAGTFFGIGAAKALVVRTRGWRSGFESLATGGAAAALASLCGRLLSGVA